MNYDIVRSIWASGPAHALGHMDRSVVMCRSVMLAATLRSCRSRILQ